MLDLTTQVFGREVVKGAGRTEFLFRNVEGFTQTAVPADLILFRLFNEIVRESWFWKNVRITTRHPDRRRLGMGFQRTPHERRHIFLLAKISPQRFRIGRNGNNTPLQQTPFLEPDPPEVKENFSCVRLVRLRNNLSENRHEANAGPL